MRRAGGEARKSIQMRYVPYVDCYRVAREFMMQYSTIICRDFQACYRFGLETSVDEHIGNSETV